MSDPLFERYKEALKQGHMAVLRGRLKEALSRYEEAARLADHRALPHLSMGSVNLQLGRHRDALDAYYRAVARDPDEMAALRGLASALAALGQGTAASAALAEVGRHETVLAERRRKAESESRAATVGAGPEALVEDALERARLGESDVAVANLVLAADRYRAARQSDASLDAAQRAVALGPASPGAHLAMVRSYLDLGWMDLAVERLSLLDRLLTLEPDDEARASLLAVCLEGAAADSRLADLAQAWQATSS